MARLWWDIANSISGESTSKRALQKHVYDWYARVVKNILDPLLKTLVERRIAELKPVLETIAANPQPAPNNPPRKLRFKTRTEQTGNCRSAG